MDRINEWIDALINIDFLDIILNPINVILASFYDLIQETLALFL